MEAVLPRPIRLLRNRSALDWAYAVALVAGALFALSRYGAHMDVYEKAILVLAAPVFIALGWGWGALRFLFAAVAACALLGIGAYGGDLARGDQAFLLKYLVSSQSAIMWMRRGGGR